MTCLYIILYYKCPPIRRSYLDIFHANVHFIEEIIDLSRMLCRIPFKLRSSYISNDISNQFIEFCDKMASYNELFFLNSLKEIKGSYFLSKRCSLYNNYVIDIDGNLNLDVPSRLSKEIGKMKIDTLIIKIYTSEKTEIQINNVSIMISYPESRVKIIGKSGENYLLIPSLAREISLEGTEVILSKPPKEDLFKWFDLFYPHCRVNEVLEATRKGVILEIPMKFPIDKIHNNYKSVLEEWEKIIKSGNYTPQLAFSYKIREYLIYKKKYGDSLEDFNIL